MDKHRRVSLEDAQRYYGENTRIRKVADKLRSRLAGGTINKCLAFRFGLLCERRDSESLSDFLYTLLCYCVGGSTVRRLLGADPTEKVCLGGAFVPEAGQILYHWTTAERLESVRKNGLMPVDEFDFVYLTDNPEYIASDYFAGKVRESKRDVDFVLVNFLIARDTVDQGLMPKGRNFLELRPSTPLEEYPGAGTLDFSPGKLESHEKKGYRDTMDLLQANCIF